MAMPTATATEMTTATATAMPSATATPMTTTTHARGDRDADDDDHHHARGDRDADCVMRRGGRSGAQYA